jgi:hypothetical protein
MPEVNHEWVAQQLQDAKVRVGSGKAIIALLNTWESIGDISENISKETIEIFSRLALGKTAKEPKEVSDEVWIPALPGQIKVGDEVRVLTDAFSDSTGVTHNGRRGKVTAVRYGDVIFKSTDGKAPELNGVHYSPYKLEKRIK